MALFRYDHRLEGRAVRLLSLQPSQGNDIHCTLVTTSLDRNPKFNALSYTWGDPSDLQEIYCNKKRLSVTRSLHNALMTLKSESDQSDLWIDAICINQADDLEKTTQVRMMLEFYQKASCVIVWLGMEQTGDQSGFSLMQKVQDIFSKEKESLKSLRPDQLPSLGLPKFGSSQWRDLENIYRRPWFSRVWVIQELCAAKQCHFRSGKIKVSEDLVLGVASKLDKYDVLHSAISGESYTPGLLTEAWQCANSLSMLRQLYAAGIPQNIFNLLSTSTFSQATDPRDRLFALVGLASGVDPSFIDYTKDYADRLTFLAASMMLAPGYLHGLNLLSDTHGSRSIAASAAPSWVPEWKNKGYPYWPLSSIFSSNEASSNLTTSWLVYNDKSLRVKGRIVDRIKTLILNDNLATDWSTVKGVGERKAISRGITTAWYDEVLNTAYTLKTYPTGEKVREAHWRTLCMNTTDLNHEIIPPSSYESVHAKWVEWIKLGHSKGLFGFSPSSSQAEVFVKAFVNPVWGLSTAYHATKWEKMYREVRDLDQRSTRLWDGRQFCITEAGYMGWVHDRARVGDHIGLFHGCRIPYTLRMRPGSQDFDLYGDAYIHGIMNGEPFRRSDLADREVIIR